MIFRNKHEEHRAHGDKIIIIGSEVAAISQQIINSVISMLSVLNKNTSKMWGYWGRMSKIKTLGFQNPEKVGPCGATRLKKWGHMRKPLRIRTILCLYGGLMRRSVFTRLSHLKGFKRL